MIRSGHFRFVVMDNSGAIIVRFIRAVFPLRVQRLWPGSIILVVLKLISSAKKLKKGQLHRALVVNTRRLNTRLDFTMVIRFLVNSVVLIKKDDQLPIASRLFIVAPLEFVFGQFKRLFTIAVYKL